MYRDQKPPESIKTTETHIRTHKITLDTREIRRILIDRGLRLLGFDQARPAGVTMDLWIDGPDERCPATGELRPTATVTITEDLSKPAITDFAPPNIEEIVRLNPPATPGLSQRQIDDALRVGMAWRGSNPYNWPMMADGDLASVVVQAKSRTLKEPTSFETPGLNTTERITRLYEVLLHGKGHNIVLSRDEVDTMLEYINAGALALDKAKGDIVFKTDGQEVMRVSGPIRHMGVNDPTSKLIV